jgi:hypothetical protein
MVHGRGLRRLAVIRARRPVSFDDAFGQKIVDMLAVARLIGREEMVEGSIFTNDHDDMLDRACGQAIVVTVPSHRAGFRRAGGIASD